MVHKSRCNCKAKVNYAGGLLPYSSGYYAHNVLSGMLGYIEAHLALPRPGSGSRGTFPKVLFS